MKLNNDLLVLDLETTSAQDEHGYQTNNDIIQIGAVLLNRQLTPIASYDSLVKPREQVSEYITQLTGITDEAAQAARPFPTVIAELEAFVTSRVANIKNVRLCAWGTYFDIPILRRLYKEHLLQFPFSGTAFDVKTMAMMYMSLSGRRTDKLSVQHVANILSLEPSGSYHDALVDAKMEARILKRIFDDLDGGTYVNGKLLKIINK